MALIEPKLSYEHLQQLPDDGKRYELIDGELIVAPAPSMPHQDAAWNLAAFLRRADEAGYGKGSFAPCDVVFDAENVTQPDLLFITTARLSIRGRDNVQGAPDLIIEILSPRTRERDLGAKLRLYARYSVAHYWAPDPIAQTVQRYGLEGGSYRELPLLEGDDLLTCPLFPGISMPVSQIFR